MRFLWLQSNLVLEGNISLVDDHLAPLAENRNFWMEDKRQPIINKPNIVL